MNLDAPATNGRAFLTALDFPPSAPPAEVHPTEPRPASTRQKPKLPLFTPPEDKIPEILDQLDSPLLSLANVAGLHNTTVEALSLWMQREDIRERNAHIDTAAAERNRSLATRMQRAALGALFLVLHNAAEEEKEQHFSDHPKASAARTKNRHLIVQAARLVQQLGQSDGAPTRRRREARRDTAPASPIPAANTPKPRPANNGVAHHNRITEYITDPDPISPSATENPRPPQPRATFPAPSTDTDNHSTPTVGRNGEASLNDSTHKHSGASPPQPQPAPSRSPTIRANAP